MDTTANNILRQGNLFSHLIFNAVIIDEIIEAMKNINKYRLDEHRINIICYTDDSVLIIGNEGDI